MAEIIYNTPSRGTKAPRKSTRIDMTPMVDLGFLLITFFIFTTSMSAPNTTGLIMPADGPPMPAKKSRVLTLLLHSGNKVFVYEGDWLDARKANAIHRTSYHVGQGAGKWIREKRAALDKLGAREELMLLIKPMKEANYRNVVDMLDEVTINGVTRYAIVEPQPEERAYAAQNGSITGN